MAPRRSSRRRKGKKDGRLPGFISDLPRGLIWAWNIWFLAVVVTLLIIFAPPFGSLKKIAIDLITPDPEQEQQTVQLTSNFASGTSKQYRRNKTQPFEDAPRVEEPSKRLEIQIRSDSVADEELKPKTVSDVDKAPEDTPVVVLASPEPQPLSATPPTAETRSFPDAASTTVNAEQVQSYKQPKKEQVWVEKDDADTTQSEPVVTEKQDGIESASDNSEKELTHPTPSPSSIKIAPYQVSKIGSITPDIQPFTTKGRRNRVVEWDEIPFAGQDNRGNTVKMSLLVLSEKYFWKFGGLSVVSDDNIRLALKIHFASSSMKRILEKSQALICIGTASEEGSLQTEESRAASRADRLIKWMIDTQPQINTLYTLGLGQYQKPALQKERSENGLSSEDQRRIIMINITHLSPGANLKEALKNGLSLLKPLPFELQRFSSFDLHNRSSMI